MYLTIPNSVTLIDRNAFFACSSLTSVTLSNSLTSIGWSAFQGCISLSNIIIPNSVTSIGHSAFYGCSGLTSITISENAKKIDVRAFGECQKLTDVYCLAGSVPTTSPNAFEKSYIEYATLHVPYNSINNYKASDPWKEFGNIVGLNDDVVGIQANDLTIDCLGNILSISGVAAGTPIIIYDAYGKIVGSAITVSGDTNINTTLYPGDIVIIKIGERSIKTIMK